MHSDIKKPEPPVEILHDSNSTGIISSIRDRLKEQSKEIIEITDTLSDVEDEDVISNTNSMSLISKDSYNAVLNIPFIKV